MSSTHINACQNCGHFYCCECSDAREWQQFCSEECQDEYSGGQEDEDESGN